MVPYINSTLARQGDLLSLAAIYQHHVALTLEKMEKGQKPWDNIGQGFVEWLEDMVKPAPEASTAKGLTPAPLAKYLKDK